MRTTPVYTHPSRLFSVLLEQGGNNGHIVGVLCVGQLVVDSVSHYHTDVLWVLIQQLSKYKHKKHSIQRTHSCLQIERIQRKLLASEHTEHSTSPISNANIRRNTLNVNILKWTSIYMYKFTWYLPQTMDEVIKKRFGFHSDLDEDSHGFQVSLVMLATVHTDWHQQILGGPGKL